MKLIFGRSSTLNFNSEQFTYPGGELNIHFPGLLDKLNSIQQTYRLDLYARLQSSDQIIALLMASNILANIWTTGPRCLHIPYLPYARQDRAQDTSAFSLKVIAGLINDLKFDAVVAYDVHSNVSPALINNLRNIELCDLCPNNDAFFEACKDVTDETVLVSPDAGAEKKVSKLAAKMNLKCISAYKIRDEITGHLTKFIVPYDSVPKRVMICDDICDGGATFINLAKALRAKGAEWIGLYVTHGIFSKGIGIFEGLINEIYTTDTFDSDITSGKSSEVVPAVYINRVFKKSYDCG